MKKMRAFFVPALLTALLTASLHLWGAGETILRFKNLETGEWQTVKIGDLISLNLGPSGFNPERSNVEYGVIESADLSGIGLAGNRRVALASINLDRSYIRESPARPYELPADFGIVEVAAKIRGGLDRNSEFMHIDAGIVVDKEHLPLVYKLLRKALEQGSLDFYEVALAKTTVRDGEKLQSLRETVGPSAFKELEAQRYPSTFAEAIRSYEANVAAATKKLHEISTPSWLKDPQLTTQKFLELPNNAAREKQLKTWFDFLLRPDFENETHMSMHGRALQVLYDIGLEEEWPGDYYHPFHRHKNTVASNTHLEDASDIAKAFVIFDSLAHEELEPRARVGILGFFARRSEVALEQLQRIVLRKSLNAEELGTLAASISDPQLRESAAEAAANWSKRPATRIIHNFDRDSAIARYMLSFDLLLSRSLFKTPNINLGEALTFTPDPRDVNFFANQTRNYTSERAQEEAFRKLDDFVSKAYKEKPVAPAKLLWAIAVNRQLGREDAALGIEEKLLGEILGEKAPRKEPILDFIRSTKSLSTWSCAENLALVVAKPN
jgi:hypothetical protein